MPRSERTRGERLYALLLRLYPRELRTARGDEMLEFYRQLERDAQRGGARERRAFIGRVAADLMRSIPAEHLNAARARRSARRGGSTREGARMLSTLLEDARFAVRTFVRTPMFTIAALVTTAIGIGATTTMFAVVDGILIRPLPYRGEGTLVQIGLSFGDVTVSSASPVDYQELITRSRTLESVAASRMQWMDMAGAGEPERLDAAGVSYRYFDVLGVSPALGRGFHAADDTRAGEAAAILSHGFWQRRFGGDPAVIGRTLTLNEEPYVVVGVMPAGFRGPAPLYQQNVELWFPLGRIGDPLDAREDAFLQLVGRLRPGFGVTEARSELHAIGEQLGREHPDVGARRFWVEDLRDRTIGDAGRLLWMLLGAVALLLLISCANVANLFLVRSTERTREMAVRAALGAGRARIARQLLTESAVLAFCGGLLGVLLAVLGVEVFRSTAPDRIPRLADITTDARVVAFALVASLLTGLVFGMAPVVQAARVNLAGRLREEGGGSAGSARGHRLRGSFVVMQTAMALVLLTGAALLLNGFARLASIDPGFEPDGVVWVQVSLPSRTYENAAARVALFERMLERVRTLPGVLAAGAIHGLPLDGNTSITSMLPEGHVPEDAESPPRVPFHSVLPGYFDALGIPLIAGRDVAPSDVAGGLPVVVINETLARRFWPGENAIGKQIRFDENSTASVVGVAGDTRHHGLAEPPEPLIYFPLTQFPRGNLAIAVRQTGAPEPLLEAIRQSIWSFDSTLPLDEFGTMRAVMSASLVEPRFRTSLLTTFAAIALLLTFVGLYGTMAHLVRARRREMGIRLALGAARRDVRRLVIRRGMRIAAIGLALGSAAAFFATRVLTSFLFGITATDPLTFAAGCAFLASVSFLACWIPARRAATVDPARTLRSD